MNYVYDLVLVGNTILDEVYTIPRWNDEGTSNLFTSYRKSIGGLGNLLKALPSDKLKISIQTQLGDDEDGRFIMKCLDNENISQSIQLSDLPTSKALILSNLNKSERTSFVRWGCANSQFSPIFTETKWCHVSYLDTLSDFDLEEAREKSKILSADLCLSEVNSSLRAQIARKIEYFDYLFVSDTEYSSYFVEENKELFRNIPKYCGIRCLIRHSKDKTVFYYPNEPTEEVKNPFEVLENKDVLGAGDYYTAGFITHCLLKDDNFKDAAISAHKTASEFIL